MDNNNIQLVSKLDIIASNLSSIRDLKTLASSINKIVDSIVDVKYNGFYLLCQETQKLKIFYAKGFTKKEMQKAEESAMERHPGWVLKNKKMLLISDTLKEKQGQSKDSTRSFVVRSRVWLPIMSFDKAVGAFGLASTQVDQFSEEHIALLSFVCNLAGVVYNNINLKNKQEQNNRNLIKALDQANRAKQIKQDFLAKMSHEIRTPMNAILGMTNLLASTELSQQQQAYSKTLTIASKNLLGLLDDILDLSRLESESYSLENIPIQPVDIIKKTYHSLKFKAREKNLNLIFNIDKKVPPFIIGDPLRLSQILINFVSNAIKFTSKGYIEISCSLNTVMNGRYRIRYQVKDTGVGIKKEKQKLIFQNFQQEDDSTTRQFGGSGLGLSIAKEIVELYGGKIGVESKKGHGSTFFFEIDFDIPKKQEFTSKETKKTLVNSLKKATILLVEDNEINRYLAITILEKYNAIVDFAENGKIAIDKIKEKSYDIILMDLQMPVMDGLTASRIIREQIDSKIPIIALTANAIRGDSNKCFDAGMNDYITKPYEETDLINKIAQLLPFLQTNKELIINNDSRNNSLLYNLSNLKAIANNNPQILIKLIHVFLDETPKMLKELRSHHELGNKEQVFSITHQLKSSIGVLSIPNLKKQLNKLESMMGAPNSDKKKATTKALILDIMKKIGTVLIELKQELKELE